MIGAGGAALAVYLTLYWHTEDVRGQTISGLYLEIVHYLTSSLTYHGLFTAALEGDEHTKAFMMAGIRRVLTFPLPVIFPHMISNIARLREPSLVTSFYNLIGSYINEVESGVPAMPESGPLPPEQMRAAVLQLFIILQSGLTLLQSSDFHQTDTQNRAALIKRIENEMAGSPAAYLCAASGDDVNVTNIRSEDIRPNSTLTGTA